MLTQPREKRCLMVITGAFNFGGGIAASNRLAIHALHDAGYQIDIVAFNEPIDSGEKYQQFERVDYTSTQNSKFNFVLKVWGALLKKKYALVFCDHVNLASVLAPLAWMRLIRYVVRVHLIEVMPPYPDFQGRLGLYNAWRIHASEYARQQLLRAYPSLKIDVVPLSLPPQTSFDLPEQATQQELAFTATDGTVQLLGDRVILMVGRMESSERYKGQDVLIQAMPYILERYPEAQLVLVGEGDDSNRLVNLAKAESVETQEHIFMLGFVPDDVLESLYSSCYLFAMPSRGEGFGLVYVEAMRWGKPCIASHIDAAQYIVQHEKTGLLVDNPTSSLDVASAILRLLSSPIVAEQYGVAGRLRAHNYYQYEQFRTRFWQTLGLKSVWKAGS
ncbi:MAG: glycosyltransferase family 4 protein [Anaerolinea sp.]|nr:glycosyltransferase family 4 protein [Anaerolinea sp.]